MMKPILNFLFLFVLSLFFSLTTFSQNCPNADFTMGNFTNWVGTTGTYNTPQTFNLTVPGIITPAYHNIMAVPGIDPNTAGGLQIIPPGYSVSARLNSQPNTGGAASQLSYTMVVDPSNCLFIYNYAVVLNDGGHTPDQQPKFEIMVVDQFNNIIPCTYYEVAAGLGIPGFHTVGSVQWKDWEKVGVDLTAYMGQPITIRARVAGCVQEQGAHFGYAYLVGECSPLEIQVEYCQGDTVATLTAPDGFSNYLWSTGETTQSITVLNPVPGANNVNCTITSVTGCVAVLNATITPVLTNAGFIFNDNCGLVQFTDTSTCTGAGNTIDQWSWDFNDAGSTSAIQNPTHQYNSSGTYDVTFIATSTAGCTDTIIVPVPVAGLPTAAFSTPTGCGLTNTFADNGSIGGSSAITNFNWDFGDANTGTGTPINHTYAISGTWNIQLVVTNADGCSDTLIQPFTNRNIPTADFTVTDVCNYDTAHFLDQSVVASANIIDWDWTVEPAVFINNTQNPNYFYAGPGLYNVQLIITTDETCYDTIVHPVNVWSVPNAAYTVNDVCLGDGSVYNNTSNIASGIITTYTWDFGDPAFPNNGLQNPTIAYTADGQYNSQLIVTSDHACVDTTTFTSIVWPMPVIDFTVDTLTHCWPFTADLTNATLINSGTIATYTWDLDFGAATNNTNESIMYPNVYGQYTITLSAISNQGCDTSITRPNYITVYPKPTADFTVATPCLGDGSVFTDASSVSSGTINIYNWNFNNASIPNSALQNPTVAYPTDGTYNVELIITTNYGCEDSITKPATVWPMPNIDFTAGPLEGCYPFTAVFDNLTVINSGTVNYTWDLDDGNGTFSSFEPSIMYPNFENSYSITLNAVSDHGCDTSITKPNYITVHPKPTASFTYTPTDLDIIHNLIHTVNLSVLADNYFWDFGTGDVSNNFEDYYQYTGDTGLYVITLITTTNFGCSDTADAIVYIKPTFTIYIPNTFTPNGDGLNDFFMVYGNNLTDVTMRIFDRWGENLITMGGSDPVTKGWNGIYKEQPAKQDVYVYRIEVTDIFGDYHEFIGQINLLR